MSAHPDLLAIWARGWALTRGVSPPSWDDGGWRVEVGLDDQLRRYVFAKADDAVARRAAAISEPCIFLKVCADAQEVRAILPNTWSLRPSGFLMTLDGAMSEGPPPPQGYTTSLWQDGAVTFCTIRHASGAEAARGRFVIVDDRVIYDRIAVDPDHRRLGLGRQVMRTLETAAGGPRKAVLVATEEGQALYRTLGWGLHSPYTTAVIPG
ncbi:MAG TPA: GNAT family N-acetyltransferase [Brevundimonas sp.]